MRENTYTLWHHSLLAGIGVSAVGLILLASMLVSTLQVDAGAEVLVRGVVKPGGSTDSVNLYITHVASAPDHTAIRGIRTDVNLAKATKYKWINQSGSLAKVTTGSNPTPEKEVVVRGSLLDDNRITAVWMVQNYREFTIEGPLQERTLDTGKTDEGWLTVNITSSKFRDIVPARGFKETQVKGKDLRIRVNGSTSVNALGASKSLEEVVAGQQKVRVEGQMNDEYVWVASKVYELNE